MEKDNLNRMPTPPAAAEKQDHWNKVVLVDDKDRAIGWSDKLQAHQDGLLHRAFSIFIFDSSGNMLLQQRATAKYHGGGLWTNACCSHPQWQEDVKDSARRRLLYEMGIRCEISEVFTFIYHTPVENDLIEHEFDHVFLGFYDQAPIPNPLEVRDFRWIAIPDLINDVKRSPENYTYWFKSALPLILEALEKK